MLLGLCGARGGARAGATAASGGTQLLPSCTTLSQAATTPKVGLASQGWISAPAPVPSWLRLSRNPPSVIKRLCLLSSFPGSSWVQALVQSHHAVQKSREQPRTMAWRKQRESRHPAARLRSVTAGCVLSLCECPSAASVRHQEGKTVCCSLSLVVNIGCELPEAVH